DDVAVRPTARDEGEPTGADVEPLAVDEDGHLAPEDVERLLLIDVDMQRRGGAARVDALHLREAAGRLLAGRLARAARRPSAVRERGGGARCAGRTGRRARSRGRGRR